jgi:hypothetical protein
MNRYRRLAAIAGACAIVLTNAPAFAQGQSQNAHGNSGNKGNGQGNGHATTPNQSPLPPPAGIAGPAAATPFAWVDAASVMAPGTVWLGMSLVRWQGSGLSEVSAPVIDGAVGLTSRVQFGMSMPRVLGTSDPAGPQGGWGTTFANVKIGIVQSASRGFNVSAAPTLEILSQAAIAGAATPSRTQWGIPVSADIERGSTRVYGSSGYFSPGVWFAGAGAGTQVKGRVGVSVSFSRAWSTSPLADPLIESPKRNELSGGASIDLTPHIGLFGSIGQTIATSPQNGAGRTFAIGMSVTAAAAPARP